MIARSNREAIIPDLATPTPNGDTMTAASSSKKKGNLTLQDVINSISGMEKNLNVKHEKEVAKLTESTEVGERLSTIEQGLNDNTDALTALQKSNAEKDTIIKTLQEKVKNFESGKRAHHLIIEGLKGKNNENLQGILDDLFSVLRLICQLTGSVTVYIVWGIGVNTSAQS